MKRVFVLILAMAVCLTPAAASDDLHSEQCTGTSLNTGRQRFIRT